MIKKNNKKKTDISFLRIKWWQNRWHVAHFLTWVEDAKKATHVQCCRLDSIRKENFLFLFDRKLRFISYKLDKKPVDLIDSSNGNDPKCGCCRSENRISSVATDPAVQGCRFDRLVRFV